MFTTILCDLDGTLIDSRRDIALAFQHALRRMGSPTLPAEAMIARHIGKPLAEMAQALGYDFSAAQLAVFLETYRGYYAAHGARHTQPYPGVTSTLQALSATSLGIVTTKAQEQAEVILEQLQLTPFFRHIQGWVPGLRLKPAPDTVLAALEALQCPPPQALMVGDTAADILAGKAAGVTTCAVTYGFGAPEEILPCQPDHVIHAFREVLTVIRG